MKLFVLKVASDISVNFNWLARELGKMRVECPQTLMYVRELVVNSVTFS